MDGTTFDQLIRDLGRKRLTRLTALRGLAVGSIAALTGVMLRGEPDAAAAGKKRKRKKSVCDCQNALATSCTTRKLGKKARRRLLASNTCAYSGKCTGVSGCAAPGPVPGATCTTNAQCSGRQACINGACGPCTAASQCGAGEACLTGQCIGPTSIPCQNAGADEPCQAVSSRLQCRPVQGSNQFFCLLGNQCQPVAPNNNVCTAAETCVLGECVVPCSGASGCTGSETCEGGYCIENS